MASDASAALGQNDLTPEEFVKKIRELGERRDQEDRERVAEIERDIIANREQRKARRADRARSLSNASSTLDSEGHQMSTSQKSRLDLGSGNTITPPMSPSPSTSPTRAGSLSWQQRPRSGIIRRPLSMIAAENNIARSPRTAGDGDSTEEKEQSRVQIAESLSGKDPSWFKQTSDRGAESAAYRRSQQEPKDSTVSSGTRFKLPGMAAEAPNGATKNAPPDSIRSVSPGVVVTSRALPPSGSDLDASSTGPNSLQPAIDTPKLTPTSSDMPPPLSARSTSPTKGMGGFVQSAMLKRSDSVNKRWSAAASPGLSRQASTASNRSSFVGGRGEGGMPRPSSLSRGDSLEPSPRPSSSHSNRTAAQTPPHNDIDKGATLHSRSKSMASLQSSVDGNDNNRLSDAPSTQGSNQPNKRWSPTKSSWLESKLSKTEEKTPKTSSPTPAASSQPSWMADLAKAKQQRMSATTDNNSLPSPEEKIDRPKPLSPSTLRSTLTDREPSPTLSTAASALRSSGSPTLSNRKSPPVAPQPTNLHATSGKVDFRANLKSRSTPNATGGTGDSEFKNAIGKLRRTQTEKFVADDELKNNILRGKASLNATGGPAKRERVDELKESLLKQKEAMKAKAAAGGDGDVKDEPEKLKSSPSTPEALSKRRGLNRMDGGKDGGNSGRRNITPEAIARQKILRDKAKQALPPIPTDPAAKSPAPAPESDSVDGMLEQLTLALSTQNDVTPSRSTPKSRPPRVVDQAPRVADQESTPSSTKKTPKSDKLADRFNPALASMIARGPPPTSGGTTASSKSGSGNSIPAESEPPKETGPLPQLTKGRAKGPKRRAPKTVGDATIESKPVETPAVEAEKPPSPNKESNAPALPQLELAPSISGFDFGFGAANSRPSSLLAKKDAASLPSALFAKKDTASIPSPLFAKKPKSVVTLPEIDAPVTKLPGKPESPPKTNLQDAKPLARVADIASPPSEDLKAPESTLKARSPELKPKALIKIETTKMKRPESKATTNTSLWDKSAQATPERKRSESSASAKSTLWSRERSTSTETKPIESPTKTKIALWSKDRPATPPPKKPAFEPSELSPTKSSVKNVAANWNRQADSSAPTSPVRSRSPIKLPTKEDEEKSVKDAGLTARSEKPLPEKPQPEKPEKPRGLFQVGLGLFNMGSSQSQSAVVNESKPAEKSELWRPLPDKPAGKSKPPTVNSKAPSLNLSGNGSPAAKGSPIAVANQNLLVSNSQSRITTKLKSPGSPVPNTSEAARLFEDFFDDRPTSPGDYTIDVLSLLESYPLDMTKVTTLRKQMQEISSDGKLSPVPSNREHILFEDSMYVCVHTFQPAKGSKTTEVYLWAGLGVSPAAVEDTQLFGKKIAKDNGGKFILLQQGKETRNFFQALGGIVITFRGSRSKASPTGLPESFMICGRSHLGHIAFDEVDFKLSSFCSGYPYLISSGSKLYLWKGAGCNAEELGCARLIAMDIGATPDVTEFVEGSEPANFMKIFPSTGKSKSIPTSASHWRMKSNLDDKYRTRLFHVSQQIVQPSRMNSALQSALQSFSPERTKPPAFADQFKCSVEELAPFSKEDLTGEGVWVLDAFFEIYIMLSPKSHTQSQAFTTALLFAQDYGILAASAEDRPFVPVSTVVLEGAPRDMKAVFRRWPAEPAKEDQESSTTGRLANGKPLKRGASMRVVGLAAALAAVRRQQS